MNDSSGLNDTHLLALCIWSEARGEPIEGKISVAQVVMNRVRVGGWYGNGIREVILKPWQFSWFNGRESTSWLSARLPEEETIAYMVKNGLVGDLVGGATHFHADYVDPHWAGYMERTIKIGKHIFYK